MSVLLQSLETGEYVQGPAQWTHDAQRALEFGGGVAALLYCYLHHIDGVRILGRSEDARLNFTIQFPNLSLD